MSNRHDRAAVYCWTVICKQMAGTCDAGPCEDANLLHRHFCACDMHLGFAVTFTLSKKAPLRQTPVGMHAQIHSILGLILSGISLLLSSASLPHELHIAAVVLSMPLGVLQAECILGGFQNMLLELSQHIWLLPNSRALVCASFAESLKHCLHPSTASVMTWWIKHCTGM